MTLALKLFRGEPAISEFVWNFTASHKSSPVIATNVRSVLHGVLPDRSTKSTRSPLNGLSVLVSTRFQVLFHSALAVLFTFPSRYCSTIGHQVVFRLGRWSSRFPTGFLVSRGTLDPDRMVMTFTYGPFTLFGRPFQIFLLTITSP